MKSLRISCQLFLYHTISDIRELVSLQRRCANNLNQVAIHVNTYGGIYPDEIKALQRDYADLWVPLSDLLKKLSAVVELRPVGERPCAAPRLFSLGQFVPKKKTTYFLPACG